MASCKDSGSNGNCSKSTQCLSVQKCCCRKRWYNNSIPNVRFVWHCSSFRSVTKTRLHAETVEAMKIRSWNASHRLCRRIFGMGKFASRQALRMSQKHHSWIFLPPLFIQWLIGERLSDNIFNMRLLACSIFLKVGGWLKMNLILSLAWLTPLKLTWTGD